MGNLLPEEMWRGCALFWHEHKHRKVIPGEYTISFNENNDIIANNTREPNKSTSKIGYDFVVGFFFLEWKCTTKWASMNYFSSSSIFWTETDRVSHFILSCVVCAIAHFLCRLLLYFMNLLLAIWTNQREDNEDARRFFIF